MVAPRSIASLAGWLEERSLALEVYPAPAPDAWVVVVYAPDDPVIRVTALDEALELAIGRWDYDHRARQSD